MTYQVTSGLAWQNVQNALSKYRGLVYSILAMHGPSTASEITFRLPPKGNPSWHRRLEELEIQGVVRRTGMRKCSITKEQAYEWAIVPGVMPVKYKAPPSEKELLRQRVKELEAALVKIKSLYGNEKNICTEIADAALEKTYDG
jgi:hypothetical protein